MSEERTLGKFNISIATSLAIEGICGIHDELPPMKKLPVNNFDEIWINARTLIRNIYGAFNDPDQRVQPVEDIANLLIAELGAIYNALEQYAGKVPVLRCYACSYHSLSRKYTGALFKEVSTDKQRIYATAENAVISLAQKRLVQSGSTLELFDSEIKYPTKRHIGMITHYPFDLIAADIPTIGLIESHTGKVKYRDAWNTKLRKHENVGRIPFDVMTVQMFGDSGGMLSPYPIKLRRRLEALAVEHRWNTLTTKDKIISGVKSAHDPELEVIVKRLYR